MPLVWLRALPWITAVLGVFFAQQQWHDSSSYPWPLVTFFIWCTVVAGWMGWRRVRFLEMVNHTLATAITLAACSLAFLIVEDMVGRIALTVALTVIPFVTLELMFVKLFEPSRYPINGVSRWNLVLVPIAACCFAMSLNGLFIFVNLMPFIAPLIFAAIGAALFGLTAHPTSDLPNRGRWIGLGAMVGLHAGILTILLPLATAVHGALAALLFSIPLRMRRYAHAPVPPQALAISEGLLAAACFSVLLLLSRWT